MENIYRYLIIAGLLSAGESLSAQEPAGGRTENPAAAVEIKTPEEATASENPTAAVVIETPEAATASENPAAASDSIPTYSDLEEFVITKKKDIIKSDGAKLTYDMEQDDSSKGQSLLDAIRKIPMVTVDGQDNIYVKGNSNFRVYVNGKEDPMLTANASRVFKAMPAESVAKVEVITEPGAKYDSEGTGGIINLITERRQTKDGYTGSASVSYSAQDTGASLYGRMKYDKVTADLSVNYANNDQQKQSMNNTMDVYNDGSDDMYYQKSNLHQQFSFNYVGANINLSWEPTEKDLFSMGGDMNGIMADIDKLDIRNTMRSRAGALQWETFQSVTGKMHNWGVSGNAAYRRLLPGEGHSITGAYRFNFGKNPWEMNYVNEVTAGNYNLPAYQEIDRDTYQREHTATLDYVISPKQEKHKIEAGVKGIFRRNSANSLQTEGDDLNAMYPAADENGNADQIQDVYAVYSSYTGVFNKVSATGGVRYEHTYMGMDFPDGSQQNFRRHLNDVTPNASVTYMFGPATNLRLAYQMRITRPSIDQLNPTVFQITQTLARSGNPDLESERYNSVSLTYSNFGPKLGGNIGMTLYQSNNTIQQYEYFNEGVLYSTYGNLGKTRKAELNGFINWNINHKMSVSANGSIFFTSIKSGIAGLKNHGWNGNYYIGWNYTGPWKVKYMAYGGQSTGEINLQGKFKGWYYYGLGISKSFMKDDALTVAVNANNFLTKYTGYRTETYTGDIRSYTYGKNRSWNVGVSLTWRFGHLQDQVKKTEADLENTDSKKRESKGGIGL